MITSELSDFLERSEKESILKAISASDKILSSGICRLLIVENDKWIDSHPPAVALFLKNSSERYYRISVIEPSTEVEWEPIVQFEHTFTNKEFETDQIHANLIIFESEGAQIGLNFYDSKECARFHDTVCKRRTKIAENSSGKLENSEKLEKKKAKKEKKSIFHGLFGHSHTKHKKSEEKNAKMEIGNPTDFKHLNSVVKPTEMTEDQEDLYKQVMSKLKTNSKEDEEIVKKIVLSNESEFRKSMMVKKKSVTVRDVKDKSSKKSGFLNRFSKAKIEDIPEPLPTVPVPKDPLNPDWGSEGSTVTHRSPTVTHVKTEWAAPRSDTFGSALDREPQNLYRFEEENDEIHQEEFVEEVPPELPSRGASRHVPEASSAPRPPNHRGSYRWATQPDIQPKNSNSRRAEDFAEIPLSPKPPTRSAPPPPPVTVPTVTQSGPSPKALPPPPPPPLPPTATSSTVPQAPPPPPPPPESLPEDIPGALPSFRMKAVPEIDTDRRSLLDQIQSADRSKILRKVSETPENRTSPTSGGGMIDQIQNFLDARRAGINPSDSEDSDDDDDEEWSD